MNHTTTAMIITVVATIFAIATCSSSLFQTAKAEGNDAGRNCGANTASTNQRDCTGLGLGGLDIGNDAGRNCGANTASTNQRDCKVIEGSIIINQAASSDADGGVN